MAAVRLARGVILYSLGRHDEAVAECEDAAQLDPDDKDIAETLAEMRRSAGRS